MAASVGPVAVVGRPGGSRRAVRRQRTPPPARTPPRPEPRSSRIEDAEAIATSEDADHVLGVAPVVSASSVTATYDGASHDVDTFTGTTAGVPADRQHGRRLRPRLHRRRLHQPPTGRPAGTRPSPRIWSDPRSAASSARRCRSTASSSRSSGILAEKGSTGTTGPGRPRHRAGHRRSRTRCRGTARSSSISVKATSAADRRRTAQSEVQAILDARHDVSVDRPRLHASTAPRRSSRRRRRPTRPSPCCSGPSPRSRCSSAASAS